MNREPDHLFVYGTLRSGFRAHSVLAQRAQAMGRGWMAGQLYDTGSYPAAVGSNVPGERVYGEVYRLSSDSAELVSELDRYEGYLPHATDASLFCRIPAQITIENGNLVDAWVYLFNRPVLHLPRIPSGDYARHVHGPDHA